MSVDSQSPGDDRRRSTRRTVLVLVVIAVAIYGGFILSGVIGR